MLAMTCGEDASDRTGFEPRMGQDDTDKNLNRQEPPKALGTSSARSDADGSICSDL